ncbi:MAG: flippase [Acidobacteriota bacterium]|nr:flippase [Acidobacteriota bacterium]
MTEPRSIPDTHLISGHRLARNTVWNLLGNGAPILVAFFCIPLIIKGLGTDRFGIVTLVWALIGYATLFDLGLGRALTQSVAQKLGMGEHQAIPVLVWTSLVLMFVFGLLGTAVVISLAPWLVHLLNVPNALSRETLVSLYLLAFSLPAVVSTAGLRGLLEAYQRFDLVNALRIPMGVFTYAAPLAVLPFSKRLVPVVAVLVSGRVLAWVAHLLCCILVIPVLRSGVVFQRTALAPLFRFGGWMTVTNVIGPFMATMDRFIVATLLSVGAVTFYATPYELITKFYLIPGSLLGVMFPAFSTSFVQDRARAGILYGRTVKYLLLTLFPLILIIVVLAHEGFSLWLGSEFAQRSTAVLQWLAVGVFLNCLAAAPFAVLQGAGRPDLTAKLHMMELPLYLVTLIGLTKLRGIEGAAIAWTGRVAIDALVLFFLAGKFLPIHSATKIQTPFLIVGAVAILGVATLPATLAAKLLFLFLVLLPFVVVTWFVLLSPAERKLVLDPVRP